MWQPLEPINIRGHELGVIQAWLHLFVREWEAHEPAPDELNTAALHELALPVYHQHCDCDPAETAARLYGSKPEWDVALYPRTHPVDIDPADVPF